MVALDTVQSGVNHQTGGIDAQTGQPITTAVEPQFPTPQNNPEQEKEARAFSGTIIDFSLSRNEDPAELKIMYKDNETHKTGELLWKSAQPLSQLLKKPLTSKDGEAIVSCFNTDCSTRTVELKLKDFLITLRESRQAAKIQFQGELKLLSEMAPQSYQKILKTRNVWVTTKEVSYGLSLVSVFFEGSFCFSSGLIRTNESDKPIQFGCSIPKAQNLEGKLIGNTEKGQWIFQFSTPKSKPLLLQVALAPWCEANPKSELCLPTVTAPVNSSTGGANTTGVTSPAPAISPAPSSVTPAPTGNQSTSPTSPSPTSPQTVPNPTAPAVQTTQDVLQLHPYFKINFKNPTTATLARSERFDKGKLIDAQYKIWTTSEKFLWVEFYKNLGRRLHEITPGFDKENMPHELLYVTFWESDYFKKPGYVISIGSSKEVGPWQFMESTGGGTQAHLKVSDLVPSLNGKTYWVCDERAQLKASSDAAARYFKWLLQQFPQNPELAILSYNWGIGFVNQRVASCSDSNGMGCIKDPAKLLSLDKAGINFWKLVEFNMAPKVRIGYVVKLLAALKLGMNLGQQQIKLSEPELNYKDLSTSQCQASK